MGQENSQENQHQQEDKEAIIFISHEYPYRKIFSFSGTPGPIISKLENAYDNYIEQVLTIIYNIVCLASPARASTSTSRMVGLERNRTSGFFFGSYGMARELAPQD